MAVAVKVNGGRRIRVCRLIGDMDLRIDAERQDLVGWIRVIAVVMDVHSTICPIRVLLDLHGKTGNNGERVGLRRGWFSSTHA